MLLQAVLSQTGEERLVVVKNAIRGWYDGT